MFPFYKQPDSKDCVPTCIKILAKQYGKVVNIQTLRNLSETTREGSNLLTLSDAAEKIGFRSLGVKLSLEKLQEAPLPCILHWHKQHYVVLYKIKSRKSKVERLFISDPAFGLLEYGEKEFLKFTFFISFKYKNTTYFLTALLKRSFRLRVWCLF